jgi:hypothetical protein
MNTLIVTQIVPADFDASNSVNFIDFSSFAQYWQQDCNEPGSCGLANLDQIGPVDFKDLSIFADCWLW